MATINTFEELYCWKKARELTKEIYKVFKDLNIQKTYDYGLQDQLQRASVSVMSNIAEGFERGTKQEFLNYLFIAKGSAGEVRTQLYVMLDAGYINIETFKYLNSLVIECSKLLKTFIDKVKTGAQMGLQYKKEYKKGMSNTNRMILENSPGLKELYNPEKDEIEFWRK